MAKDFVSVEATWDPVTERLVMDDQRYYLAALRAMQPGAGEVFTVRVERQAEAWRHADLKHYYGHFVRPIAAWTGYTTHEVHETVLKPRLMPEGKRSLLELSREELRAYIEAVEHFTREEIPEATEHPDFAGRRYVGRR